ncbi:TraB/TrbI/VirB10 family type IV secretion system protein [Desulfosarcina cetonica]|uniref:TrbI/VirB10 family protein n=1 Tax=Desulfosarcina cetonica TaxID=90730 RepID=UPI00155D9B0B|nr:TrbI/VirB10 family protein [Desulfosarcina cetonica]
MGFIEMSDEKEKPEVKERDPNHRRKMQWFGAALVVLLCITLALSALKKPSLRLDGGEQRKDLPIDVQRQHANSEDALQEQIRQKRRKLQRDLENGVTDPDAQMTREERIKAIRERHEAELKAQADEDARRVGGGHGNTATDILKEFRLQEKRRALMARRSSFGFKNVTTSASPSLKQSTLKMGSAGISDQRAMVNKQYAIAAQMLKNIQEGQEPGKGINLSGLLGQSAETENKEIHERELSAKDPTIVGQPASESEQQVGQKLIPTATVINGVLDKKIISDYPGPMRGLITRDVYDVTGSYVVIPKGSQFSGKDVRTSNVNEPIQARMGLLIRWIILPDGKRISMEKRSAGMDQEGVSAIKDKVNYHFVAQFLGVAAYAVLSSETTYEGTGTSNDKTFEGNLSESMREQFAPLAAKYLNLVPTITLNIGTPVNIFLEDDIYAYPWQSLSERVYHSNRSTY